MSPLAIINIGTDMGQFNTGAAAIKKPTLDKVVGLT